MEAGRQEDPKAEVFMNNNQSGTSKITFASVLARFGPTLGGVLGILLLSYGFLEPHRPWFIGGSLLLGAGIIASRLGLNRFEKDR